MFFLKDSVFGNDNLGSECLRINDIFFTAEWMVRVEVKK